MTQHPPAPRTNLSHRTKAQLVARYAPQCVILFLSVLPPFRRDCTIYDGSTIYDDVACFKECDGGMVGNKPVGTNPNGIVRVTRFPRK